MSEEERKPHPESLCHRCAAPPRYVKTGRSVFILCPLLPPGLGKYPPQPVLRCGLFRPLAALLLLLLARPAEAGPAQCTRRYTPTTTPMIWVSRKSSRAT